MRRREFIGGLAGAAAWPGYAWAQAAPVIGWLHSASFNGAYSSALESFRTGLRGRGYVENGNITIDYQWANDDYTRLPALANDLAAKNVSLIMAGGGDVSALAAKSATETIPIVFAIGADPVKIGIVESFNLPGRNITGVSFLSVQIRPKMVELIREFVPSGATIAVLENPSRPGFEQSTIEVTKSAQIAGLEVQILQARNEQEIDAAFSKMLSKRVDALLVISDPFFINRRDQIVELITARRLPSIHATREFVSAGGLMSYGASITDAYHEAGIYAGRILAGEKPANIPVKQASRLELVISLKAAKALGLSVPPSLLARADEVIE